MAVTPLVRYAGNDWKGANAFSFTYSGPTVGGAPGSPINLTGFVPSGVFYFGNSQLPLTVANGRAAMIDAVNGKFELSVAAADTPNLIPQTAKATGFTNRLEIQLTDPSGNLQTLCVAPILVLQPGTVSPC